MSARVKLDMTYFGQLGANQEVIDVIGGGPIPVGARWRLKKMGGSAVGVSGTDDSHVRLEMTTDGGTSWSVIRLMGMAGAAGELPLDMDVLGDGQTQLRLIRRAAPGQPKDFAAWIVGFVI
jgi:hypothetical protein